MLKHADRMNVKKNHLIYLSLLLLATGFVSFYGGSVPYLLFYFILLLPVFCLAYTLLVYARFRVHQKIDQIRLIKKMLVPYESILANEDYYTYTSLKPEYFDDFSHIFMPNEISSFEIQPKSSLSLDGFLCADFRGTFEAGIRKIEIKDFLYFFTIRYPLMSRLKIIVSPRIVTIHKLNLLQWNDDNNRIRKIKKGNNEVYDPELRKYVPGDNRKQIHWKASAKKSELLTRKQIELEEPQPYLFMDLQKTQREGRMQIALEDNIIEMTLAIISQFLTGKTSIHVCCQEEGYHDRVIADERSFEFYYGFTTEVTFRKVCGIEELMRERLIHSRQNTGNVILVTGIMNLALMECLLTISKNQFAVTLFYFGILEEEMQNGMLQVLKDAGIITYIIHPEEDIEILYGKTQSRDS